MRKFFLFLLVCYSINTSSQIQKDIDSLYTVYNATSNQLKKHTTLYEIGRKYAEVNLDSATSILRRTILEAKGFKSDSLILKSQLAMALSFSRMSKYDSAQYYYEVSEKIFQNFRHSELEKTLYINKGILFFYQRQYNKASDEFKRALDVALKENHYEDMGRCYNNIALCKAYAGEYEEALKMHIESAKLAEKLGQRLSLAQSYNNIGLVYSDLENHKKAEEYLLKALEIKKEEGSNIDIIGGYINLGNTTRKIGIETKEKETLIRAKEYYYKGLKLSKEANYVRGRNNIYVSLALIETTLENYTKGIELGKEAIIYSQSNKDSANEMVARINLGDAYRLNKQYTKAEDQLLKALEMTKESNNMFYQKETLLIISKLYGEKGSFKKAYSYHKDYYELSDSIASVEVKNSVNELETKYETEKKEKEIAIQKQGLLDQELQIKSRDFYIILVCSILLILLIISIGFYKRHQFKRQQLQKELDLKDALSKIKTQNKLQEQRLEISRDLHDNIGSQLTFIISSIDNLKYISKGMNDQIKAKLSNISSFTFDTIHQLRDTIWAMNKNQIMFDEFQSRIMSYIEKAKAVKSDIQFKFNSSVDSNTVFTSVIGMNLFRVIQEGINNAIKHSEANEIEINARQEDQQISIEIKDNGKGFDKENFEAGNGLANIENRISTIQGTVSIETELEKGTIIIIKIEL
ncbi:MAG: tetratricopeptide repeat protein [Flavobacteriaceae bacterium]